MVVIEAILAKRAIEGIKGCDRELVETGFERAKETLHATVLPWAMKIGSLMTDAEHKERQAKHARCEDGLIIGSDHLGFAIAFN